MFPNKADADTSYHAMPDEQTVAVSFLRSLFNPLKPSYLIQFSCDLALIAVAKSLMKAYKKYIVLFEPPVASSPKLLA